MIVSIVIPVFNAEKYLKRLMESLIYQTFLTKNLGKMEIILVDNNSTDNPLKIIRDYEKKFPKVVRVFQYEKWGAAAVRNFGFLKATGKYVWFIDADDEITLDAVEKLVNKAEETEAELVMMGAKIVRNDEKIVRFLTAVDENDENWQSRFVRYGMGPWQVFFRRDWWKKCGWKFGEGMIYEDIGMMSALVTKIKKYASVSDFLYIYYQNDGSVLHQKGWNKHYFDTFPVLEGLIDRFGDDFAKYRDDLEWLFIWSLLLDDAKNFCKYKEGRSGIKKIREMMKKYFPNWRKNKFLREKNIKIKIKTRIGYWGLYNLFG